ncbi:hypothetical protein EUGRSUZ_K02619 [Eucalyptus grandis]|uniref:Uncharacterized protein n=2 Tax=Eucalyptus grandis TaxID=71139 RepID=A0ACC3IWC6_EUCGR|nr:hypothetical protein EUGRSUZ_K02619 [Eucalyptus grandis]
MQQQLTAQVASPPNPASTLTPAPAPGPTPPPVNEPRAEAPPKQVALAMDRLSQAARLIADVRLGADRILEALFVAAQPHQSTKPHRSFTKEDASMRQHLQDLRAIALKAFTDQKRRFFPHLDDGLNGQSLESEPKRHCGSRVSTASQEDAHSNYKTLSDVLIHMEKEMPSVKVLTHGRLDWLKRASSLPSSANENLIEASKEHSFHGLNRLRPSPVGTVSVNTDKVAVIELLVPSVFRALISLHPAGSVDPDAVAFFSPDEGGSYVHARGHSVHHVFRHITCFSFQDHAAMALQYFVGVKAETALLSLLRWISSYQTLFTKVCSECGRLLSMDKRSALLLPPVHRPYMDTPVSSTKDQSANLSRAYHLACYPEQT